MSGAKNRAALKGMKDIYDLRVREADKVSLILFSSSMEIALPLMAKGANHAHILQQLGRYTSPNGGTAFFDALGEAFRQLTSPEAAASNSDKWIVALTDGEDNQSKVHSIESLKVLAFQNPNLSLIIVAVGDFTGRDQLNDLCSKTKNGKLIDVDDKEGVEHSISAAFQEIGNMMEADVETYNFKSE